MTATLRHQGALASRLLDADPGDWRGAAACVEYDPELFFPAPGYDAGAAKTICGGCPVMTQCRTSADQIGDDWAVLGGMTAAERRQRNQLKGRFQSRIKVTESDETSGTLRKCLRCRAPFTSPGKARYCSRQCRSRAVLAMRSGWRSKEGTTG